VQASIDRPNDRDPSLSVIDPVVVEPDETPGVHLRESVEANASRFPIPDTLGFVEFDQHDYIVSTIKSRRPVESNAATDLRGCRGCNR